MILIDAIPFPDKSRKQIKEYKHISQQLFLLHTIKSYFSSNAPNKPQKQYGYRYPDNYAYHTPH